MSGYRTTQTMAKVCIETWGSKTDTPDSLHGAGPRLLYLLENIRDPHGETAPGKRFADQIDGRGFSIRTWMMEDPRVQAIVKDAVALACLAVDGQHETFISIGIVDHHGKWGSVAVAEALADAAVAEGLTVHVWHRELGIV